MSKATEAGHTQALGNCCHSLSPFLISRPGTEPNETGQPNQRPSSPELASIDPALCPQPHSLINLINPHYLLNQQTFHHQAWPVQLTCRSTELAAKQGATVTTLHSPIQLAIKLNEGFNECFNEDFNEGFIEGFNECFNEGFNERFIEQTRWHSRLLTQPSLHLTPASTNHSLPLLVSQRVVHMRMPETCSEKMF